MCVCVCVCVCVCDALFRAEGYSKVNDAVGSRHRQSS